MLIINTFMIGLMVEGVVIGFSDIYIAPRTIGIVVTMVLTLFF